MGGRIVVGVLVAAVLGVGAYLAFRDGSPSTSTPSTSARRVTVRQTSALVVPVVHLPKICSTFKGWDHPDLCGNQQRLTLREALTVWPGSAFRSCARELSAECPPSDLIRQYCQTYGGCA
jgi:hypothetical protein